MKGPAGKVDIRRLFEWIAALIGAVNCLFVSIVFWQGDFPAPALYLIEIALLGLFVVAFVAARARLSTRWNALPWVAAGILLAFVILGGFSIGFFLIPAFLAFAIVGVLADTMDHRAMARHFGFLLVAAVAHAAVMLMLVRIS